MPHTYTSVNEYLQNRFGEKIYKLSLNAGRTEAWEPADAYFVLKAEAAILLADPL